MNKRNISKMTLAMMLCVLMCSFMLTGCSKKKEARGAEEVETVFAVYALKVNNSNLDDYLAFGGNVQAASSVDIYPDVQSGKITRILVKVGEVVQKNQVLAEVDSSRPGMDYKVSPIKAPVSGTVTSLPINVGSTVAASMAIGKISSTGKLEIKTNVAERFISRIGLYQKAELTFDA
ncbi:MAG: biotin/lipoyl-binding protein, partial [Treponemataceae bacterium]|nr:biotin/lipoyl-binding protein [Treponemataceae bacterium]